jgi:ribosomal protein S18 acetylase RimI-like enzyme
MLTIDVREGRVSDAAAVAQCHVASVKAVYADLLAPEALDGMSLEKRTVEWKEALTYAEPQTWVAELDGQIVGFAGFDRSRDEKSKSTTAEIWSLYVLPDHWDSGVGLALWDALQDAMIDEGFARVSAWVPMLNERAMRFFRLAGFKPQMTTARTSIKGGVRIEEVRVVRADIR